MPQPIKVAAYQAPDVQNDIDSALSHVRNACVNAGDASLICFPECFLQGYTTNKGTAKERAIDFSSDNFSAILRQIKDLAPILVIGLIESSQGNLYNTAVAINRGELIGSYRKIHLLDRESCFSKGSESPVFELERIKFGINICYDARFEEGAQQLANQSAKLILYPLNNTLPKDVAERWKDRHIELLSERAKQTGAWIVSADVVHEDNTSTGYGCTAIIDPAGQPVKQVEHLSPGLVVTEIER